MMWKVCFILLIVETAAALIEPDNTMVGCSRCGPGFFVKKMCDGSLETECEQCPDGFFTDSYNLLKKCHKCSACSEQDFEFKRCHATHNVQCKPCSSTDFTHHDAYKSKCKTDQTSVSEGSGDITGEKSPPILTNFTKIPEVVDIEEGSGFKIVETTSEKTLGRTETLSPLDATVDELLPLKPTGTTKLEANGTGIQITDVKQGKGVQISANSEPEIVHFGDKIINLDSNTTYNTHPESTMNSPIVGESEKEPVSQDDNKVMIALIVIVLVVVIVFVIVTVILLRKKFKQKKFNVMRKSNGTNGFVKKDVQKDNGSHDEGVYDENDEKPMNGTYHPTHTPPLTKKELIGDLHAKPLKNSLQDPYLSRDSIKFIDETDDEGLKATTTDPLLSDETSFSDHNDSGITDSTEGVNGTNGSKEEEESTPMLPNVGGQKEKD